MGRLIHSYEESTVNQLSALNQKLSILIGMDSFDYIVSDNQNEIKAFKSYALNHPVSSNSYTEFEDLFRSDPLLNRSYGACVFCSFGPFFTLVPGKLYKEDFMEKYLEQVADPHPRYKVYAEALRKGAHQNVFALHHFLDDWILSRFNGAHKSHLISALFRYAFIEVPDSSSEYLYVYRSGSQIAFLLVKGAQLHFANIFSNSSNAQLIYYIGLIFNQFRVSQLDLNCILLGDFSQEYLAIFQRFINKVSTAKFPSQITLAAPIQAAPLNAILVPAVGLLE